MHYNALFNTAILSTGLVSSMTIGAAVAQPFGSHISRDASASSSAPDSVQSVTVAANGTGSNPSSDNKQLVGQLVTAATAVERYKLLQNDDFAYDFKNPPKSAVTEGAGKLREFSSSPKSVANCLERWQDCQSGPIDLPCAHWKWCCYDGKLQIPWTPK
jgi:hypothetical protein